MNLGSTIRRAVLDWRPAIHTGRRGTHSLDGGALSKTEPLGAGPDRLREPFVEGPEWSATDLCLPLLDDVADAGVTHLPPRGERASRRSTHSPGAVLAGACSESSSWGSAADPRRAGAC